MSDDMKDDAEVKLGGRLIDVLMEAYDDFVAEADEDAEYGVGPELTYAMKIGAIIALCGHAVPPAIKEGREKECCRRALRDKVIELLTDAVTEAEKEA